MNLRTLKRLKQTRMGLLFADLWAGRRILAREARAAGPKGFAGPDPFADINRNMALAELLEPVVSIYKVARVKDNVVVLETESREEAQELIDKNARQKKAKLFLLSGEPFIYPA